MATRTIENKRDRIATILIAPFMTCSARLPVYTLIIAAFIPEHAVCSACSSARRAAAMLGLYIIGFLAAIVTAQPAQIDRSQEHPILVHAGDAALSLAHLPFARLAAARSLEGVSAPRRHRHSGVAIVIWVLSNLPVARRQAAANRHSFAGMIGHAVEPAIRPLGFNWKIGIGLITSLAAREVIVGTLGTIYGVEGTSESGACSEALHQDLTPGGAAALLVFFAFAMQCMSTVAVVRRETGWLALAGHPVRLHDGLRVRVRLYREPRRIRLVLVR